MANGWTDQDETWHAGRPRPCPHCVRLGPSFPPQKGHSPYPIFGPYMLRPNGCMDQDVTWCMELGLSPGDFVLDGDPVSFLQKGWSPLPKFSAHLYCGEMAACIKMPLGMELGFGLGRRLCVRWGPSSHSQKGDGSPLPNCRSMFIVAKRLDG